MTIAVIGGSGLVGSMIVPVLASGDEVRIIDPVPPGFETDAAWRAVDWSDSEAATDAFHGCTAVVFAAMGRKDGWEASVGWTESQFDVNVKLLWLVADAAARAGVERLVHLSTMSIFDDYLAAGADEDAEPDASDVYGLTKRMGELVCATIARRSATTAVSLRLVGPLPDDEWLRYDDPVLAPVVTAGRDVAEAVRAAIRLELAPGSWEAFTISGDGEQQVLAQQRSHDRLGWRPRSVRPAPSAEVDA